MLALWSFLQHLVMLFISLLQPLLLACLECKDQSTRGESLRSSQVFSQCVSCPDLCISFQIPHYIFELFKAIISQSDYNFSSQAFNMFIVLPQVSFFCLRQQQLISLCLSVFQEHPLFSHFSTLQEFCIRRNSWAGTLCQSC